MNVGEPAGRIAAQCLCDGDHAGFADSCDPSLAGASGLAEKSLIANHQAPCPLGDTVLVQPTLDGSVWHIDPECPIITLNRAHLVEEHEHCEYCCPRSSKHGD